MSSNPEDLIRQLYVSVVKKTNLIQRSIALKL